MERSTKSLRADDPVVTEDGTVARIVERPDGSATIEVWSGGRWVPNKVLRFSDLMLARRAWSKDIS